MATLGDMTHAVSPKVANPSMKFFAKQLLIETIHNTVLTLPLLGDMIEREKIACVSCLLR
jgi:hypothetical protein